MQTWYELLNRTIDCIATFPLERSYSVNKLKEYFSHERNRNLAKEWFSDNPDQLKPGVIITIEKKLRKSTSKIYVPALQLVSGCERRDTSKLDFFYKDESSNCITRISVIFSNPISTNRIVKIRHEQITNKERLTVSKKFKGETSEGGGGGAENLGDLMEGFLDSGLNKIISFFTKSKRGK